jgi:hypothetical protein
MRRVLSGLLMRGIFCTIPLLLVADFARALGKGVSLSTVVFAVVIPIIGLVVDTIRVRNDRAVQGNPAAPRPKVVQPLQFRLRTLLLVVTFAAIYCGLRCSTAVSHTRAITEMRAAGIPVAYDFHTGSWLEGLFGLEMFGTVKEVTLRDDAEVNKYAELSGSKKILLWGSGVTDAAVDTLADLPQLEELTLDNTGMTVDGINCLKRSLPNCNVIVYPQD